MNQTAERTALNPRPAAPTLPVGNAPPISPWLIALAAAAWLAGIVFLIVMASWRLRAG